MKIFHFIFAAIQRKRFYGCVLMTTGFLIFGNPVTYATVQSDTGSVLPKLPDMHAALEPVKDLTQRAIELPKWFLERMPDVGGAFHGTILRPEDLRQVSGVLDAIRDLATHLREINLGELARSGWNWIRGVFKGGR